jgi:lariat debranching enzyme
MRIAFVGDIHGRIVLMYEKVQELGQVDMIFQVGDFGVFLDKASLDRATIKHDGFIPDFSEYHEGIRQAPMPTYFIKGNHEDFDFLEAHEHDNEVAGNIFYLPNQTIIKPDGRIKIGVLGGNWSWAYYMEGRIKKKKDERQYFSQQDVEFFRKHLVDILLFHTYPQKVMKNGEDKGSPRLTELVEEMQPRYAFHGHRHRYNHAKIGSTEVIGLDIIKGEGKFIYILEL